MTRKLKKQGISMVYNFSSITLTPEMESVLNRGMNFCPTPDKLDFTQVLADHNRFARTMFWTEFWANVTDPPEWNPGIFRKKKTNLPKNHPPPAALKTFISATRSELSDPGNRNKNVL